MKYLIELTDGSKVKCNELIEQEFMVSAIIEHKPKWYQFWKRSCTNDMYTFKYDSIKGIWIKGLSDEEMLTHIESIDIAMQGAKKMQAMCGEECEDCDGDVDPEATPSSYFQFAPVNPNMYV